MEAKTKTSKMAEPAPSDNKEPCERCGERINKKSMATHLASKKCEDKAKSLNKIPKPEDENYVLGENGKPVVDTPADQSVKTPTPKKKKETLPKTVQHDAPWMLTKSEAEKLVGRTLTDEQWDYFVKLLKTELPMRELINLAVLGLDGKSDTPNCAVLCAMPDADVKKCDASHAVPCMRSTVEKLTGTKLTAEQWLRFMKIWEGQLTMNEIVKLVVHQSNSEPTVRELIDAHIPT